jgi:Plavaka transposase
LNVHNPWQIERKVFPMIYAIVTDHPEGCKMTCTKDTNITNKPCSQCLVDKSNLSDMNDISDYRTVELTKEILRRSDEDPNLLTQYSMHNVTPFFFGFNGAENSIYGNPYKAIMVETMHNVELGIWTYLIEYLREVCKKAICIELDRKLKELKFASTIPGFRLPTTDGGGYFWGGKNFHAFEHKSVIQVICVLLKDLVSPEIFNLFYMFYKWYILACRSTFFTERDLERLKELTEVLVKKLIEVFGSEQKSNFNLPKVHALLHYPEAIRRAGVTSEYCANLWESLHIGLVKQPYRAGNRKDTNRYILKMSIRKELMESLKNVGGIESTTSCKTSPMQRV